MKSEQELKDSISITDRKIEQIQRKLDYLLKERSELDDELRAVETKKYGGSELIRVTSDNKDLPCFLLTTRSPETWARPIIIDPSAFTSFETYVKNIEREIVDHFVSVAQATLVIPFVPNVQMCSSYIRDIDAISRYDSCLTELEKSNTRSMLDKNFTVCKSIKESEDVIDKLTRYIKSTSK